MLKLVLVAFFLLISSVPSWSRSSEEYPVSCDVVWGAVKDTLYSNPRDYGIQSMNNVEWRASFIVLGNLTVFTDRVELRTTDSGCAMKTNIIQIGPDNSDWRRFHKRVGRAIDKMQAASGAPATPGAKTETETPKKTGPPS
ncbi:hypothetical protein [Occallatibacter riparius]|uniref:DUF3576 domain-containing protein n=1 Tax=Occallatibacter riparius TaxID=1002689 RepID=A0A9J7BYZ0_9BACT|nr:hypothetical protein [Occallatibacter riparius]UWZ86877.1 hypothetical protein MOP44_13225 [Occallatibacter riparius]